jgi:hypothetical protein
LHGNWQSKLSLLPECHAVVKRVGDQELLLSKKNNACELSGTAERIERRFACIKRSIIRGMSKKHALVLASVVHVKMAHP